MRLLQSIIIFMMFIFYMSLFYLGYIKLSFIFMNITIMSIVIYKVYKYNKKSGYLYLALFLAFQFYLMYGFLY